MFKKISKILMCSFVIITLSLFNFNIPVASIFNGNETQVVYANSAELWSGAIQEPSGSGLELDPYLISKAEELAWISNESRLGIGFSGVFFKQTADIDLGGQGDALENIYLQQKWTPIGLGDAEISTTSFGGIYDGANFVIYNMYVDSSSVGDNQGLFGYVVNGEIKNVRLDNAVIETEERNSGLIAGKIDGTTIENCYASGSVIAGDVAGGIVGEASNNSYISNVTSTATVGGDIRIGGISGYLKNSDVINCANLGVIISNSSSSVMIGGIAGESNAGDISLSYSVGEIKTLYSQTNAGEIVGSNGGNVYNIVYESNLVNGSTIGLPSTSSSAKEDIQSGVDLVVAGFDIKETDSVWVTDGNAYPEQVILDGCDFSKTEKLVVRCKVSEVTSEGGSLSADGIEIVDPSDDYTVTISPNYSWEILSIYINGVELSTSELSTIKETNTYTFYDIQEDEEIEVVFIESTLVTITYDTNSTISNIIVEMRKGNSLALLPTLTRDGYILEGWFTSLTNGERITEDTIIDGVATYYAVWSNADIDVMLNPNGGTGAQISLSLDYSETLNSQDYETPTKSGYKFAGWNTIADGSGEMINEDEALTYSLSLYAQWEKDSSSLLLISIFVGLLAVVITGLFIAISTEKAIKDKPIKISRKTKAVRSNALRIKNAKTPKKRGLGSNYSSPVGIKGPVSKGPTIKRK